MFVQSGNGHCHPPASRIVGRGPSLAQMERNAHDPEGGQTGSFKGSAHVHFKKQDTGIGSPKGRLKHQPHPNELKNRPWKSVFWMYPVRSPDKENHFFLGLTILSGSSPERERWKHAETDLRACLFGGLRSAGTKPSTTRGSFLFGEPNEDSLKGGSRQTTSQLHAPAGVEYALGRHRSSIWGPGRNCTRVDLQDLRSLQMCTSCYSSPTDLIKAKGVFITGGLVYDRLAKVKITLHETQRFPRCSVLT